MAKPKLIRIGGKVLRRDGKLLINCECPGRCGPCDSTLCTSLHQWRIKFTVNSLYQQAGTPTWIQDYCANHNGLIGYTRWFSACTGGASSGANSGLIYCEELQEESKEFCTAFEPGIGFVDVGGTCYAYPILTVVQTSHLVPTWTIVDRTISIFSAAPNVIISGSSHDNSAAFEANRVVVPTTGDCCAVLEAITFTGPVNIANTSDPSWQEITPQQGGGGNAGSNYCGVSIIRDAFTGAIEEEASYTWEVECRVVCP